MWISEFLPVMTRVEKLASCGCSNPVFAHIFDGLHETFGRASSMWRRLLLRTLETDLELLGEECMWPPWDGPICGQCRGASQCVTH